MTAPDADSPAGPIEDYLDRLVALHSTSRPRALRHLLAEVEAHLRDDAAAGEAAGLSRHVAEAQAVRRFGPAESIVAAEARRQVPVTTLARQIVTSGVLLGGIGAVAVGLSGVVAALIRVVGGARALVDVAPGQVLSASDCARWLANDPGAANCHDAAVADWVTEVIGYRLAAGVLGVLALALLALLRRRWVAVDRWTMLPAAVTDTIAVTVFSIAGLWTLGSGIDLVAIASGYGSGQWFAAALVALAATAVFGVRLARDLRYRQPLRA